MEPAKKRRATYQDVIDSPPHMVAEIIGGELRLSNRPANPASIAAATLHGTLMPSFHWDDTGPGGWIIMYETELHLGDDVVVPDIAGWRRDRMPSLPDTAFNTVPPDWICEVLSKSTEKIDRLEKMPLYAAFGVQYAWLVHPRRRTLEAFQRRGTAWTGIAVYQGPDRARIAPFDAIEVNLARLWADVTLPTRASEPEPQAEYVPGPY
jgi:Uma2 family endonuclease